jgi:hypothetical protein
MPFRHLSFAAYFSFALVRDSGIAPKRAAFAAGFRNGQQFVKYADPATDIAKPFGLLAGRTARKWKSVICP